MDHRQMMAHTPKNKTRIEKSRFVQRWKGWNAFNVSFNKPRFYKRTDLTNEPVSLVLPFLAGRRCSPAERFVSLIRGYWRSNLRWLSVFDWFELVPIEYCWSYSFADHFSFVRMEWSLARSYLACRRKIDYRFWRVYFDWGSFSRRNIDQMLVRNGWSTSISLSTAAEWSSVALNTLSGRSMDSNHIAARVHFSQLISDRWNSFALARTNLATKMTVREILRMETRDTGDVKDRVEHLADKEDEWTKMQRRREETNSQVAFVWDSMLLRIYLSDERSQPLQSCLRMDHWMLKKDTTLSLWTIAISDGKGKFKIDFAAESKRDRSSGFHIEFNSSESLFAVSE